MDMEQDEAEILEDIIKGVNELLVETKQSRKELEITKARLENLRKDDKVSLFDYTIEKERMRSSEESIEYCLKSLERQKKIAIYRLMKLN